MEKESSEIAKLTERIAKDPKSKLFVPLAEEHKKAGDIETAIRVLMDGLKNNPGYVTARSFLGRLLMEKGDLAGAQKELEEVIKTIPDNLLAQRKLGDIYVLSGRNADALQRYKACLALNPADKELPSMLADLEAGKDISSRIPKPKVQAPPAAPVPQAPQAAAGASAPRPAVVSPSSPEASKVPPAPAKTPPPAKKEPVVAAASPKQAPLTEKPKPQSEAIPAPAQVPSPAAPAPDEVEVIENIEDIMELEPAEPKSKPVPSAIPDFLREPDEARSSPDAHAHAEPAFDLTEKPTAKGIPMPGVGEQPDTTRAAEAVHGAGIPPAPDEGRDDLNTNTLAELYISQGFYDKAIEIYQGMLNDRPGNKALQQKLDQIRAMAGTADAGREVFTPASEGPGEYVPPSADVFADAGTKPLPAPPSPAKEAAVPAEQLPAEKVPQRTAPERSEEPAQQHGAAAATIRRKETIDRLESWLKNIMKEKPE